MKKFLIKCCALILIFLWVNNAFAQESPVFEVRGRLIDSAGVGVQFAHLINLKKSVGTISDAEGYFRILMLSTDTIKITCLGFEDSGFTLSGQYIKPNINQVTISDIQLISKIYELNTVSIFEERWHSFVYDYTHQPEPSDAENKAIQKWFQNLVNPEIIRQISQSASAGITFTNPNRKRIKADKRISQFEYHEELNRQANERYNPQIVSQITGITEQEAEEFIKHCKLSREYILQKNDYDMYIIITQLYKEYLKIKQ